MEEGLRFMQPYRLEAPSKRPEVSPYPPEAGHSSLVALRDRARASVWYATMHSNTWQNQPTRLARPSIGTYGLANLH
jgi:hypothetical protein